MKTLKINKLIIIGTTQLCEAQINYTINKMNCFSSMSYLHKGQGPPNEF